MVTKKLFLASSAELKDDRIEFEVFINRKNKDWVARGVFLELVVWEDFLDAVSHTRLQDEYNKAIRECDLFVMLFWTKVGQYTEEEFETAFGQFQATNRPFIFTYFKDAEISTGSANRQDLTSLWAFQDKLKALDHFYTTYKNVDELKYKFNQQLDKLAANGFIQFQPDRDEAGAAGGATYQANLTGNGAIAQGNGATAVGARGVYVGGKNTGNINTGKQIDTGGGAYIRGNVTAGGDFVGRDKVTTGVSPGELETLFAPFLAAIGEAAPEDQKTAALHQAQALKSEVAKGEQAEDGKIATIVNGLVDLVPKAVGAIVSLFATPFLSGIAGPVTNIVLDNLKRSRDARHGSD